ncbi:MAG: class II aldolase/adducin family protein [Candidatus Eisenbacteria sp.]|nr:class II aldolase/adducin family protein [Candidatus Eisenbacteria bacterium]
MKSEFLLRREIVEVGRRLYARGLVAATDGNISVRLRGDRILVTPAESCLGELRPEELIVVPSQPTPLSPRPVSSLLPQRLRPTSELPMHRQAYIQRPEIGAVVHAHPPIITAFTVAGLSLAAPVLPEVAIALGPVPTAPYATPSTDAGARAIEELIRTHDAILLDRHGAITVGTNPLDAYRKLEKLEHCAQVVLAAHQLGRIQTLPPDEVARLQELKNVGGAHGPLPRP